MGNGPPGRRSKTLWRNGRPYIETCIEFFGPGRCMFESNFPVDRLAADYRTLWNVFKTIASGYFAAEKINLFSANARRVYSID